MAKSKEELQQSRQKLQEMIDSESYEELSNFLDEHDAADFIDENAPDIHIEVSPNIRRSKPLIEEEKRDILAGREPVKK